MDADQEFENEESAAPARQRVSSGEITLYACLAILAAACFAALITLQVIEFFGYSSPPSVWPATL